MISRIRFIITTLLGSHLILVPALLTSQLRSDFPGRAQSAHSIPAPPVRSPPQHAAHKTVSPET